MPSVPVDFGGVIKGKKTVSSLRGAVADELARGKIAANEVADRIDLNLRMLREVAGQHSFLFADTAAIVLKAPDDCRALAENRIAAHQAAEARKEEETRERIRAEEAARADREAREKLAAEQAERDLQARRDAEAAKPVPTPAPAPIASPAPVVQAPNVVPMGTRAPAPAGATLRLGQINEQLAPIAITAEGLASLGFQPVATEKAAKLFRAADLTLICDSLVAHLRMVQHEQQAA